MEDQLKPPKNQIPEGIPAFPQEFPAAPEIGLGTEELLRLKEESETSKKRSGYFLLFLITLLLTTVNVVNAMYFKNNRIISWSVIIYMTFLFPILFAKFDLLEIVIKRFAPFLREPEDFIKRMRERRQTEISFQQAATS